MGKHALLSASSSQRWMNCPPSARLCENYDDKGSAYAQEGTDAHTLCEYKLQTALGIKAKDPTATLTYYDSEMEDCSNSYAEYILELLAIAKDFCPDPLVLTEQRVDFSKYVPDGFGTCDTIIVSDDRLTIVDLKYGRGVQVEAEGNSQMRLYALGALEMFDGIYNIQTVEAIVYQPRRDNISSETLSKETLLRWANEVLKPAAELAFAGNGEFQCGNWCQFCKAKHDCRTRAEHNLELAKYDFHSPPLLETYEIADILCRVDELVSWASDIKEYALTEAIKGVKFDGFKVVEGRSNRRYIDDTAVAETVTQNGHDPYEHKLLGITAMEKLLTKKRFAELLGNLVEKPQGKPTLVPIRDKRQEININSAADDFADHEN